ncbi:MAG: glutaminase [Paludibacteraceae bacterium]|nr:glutaminase [Paludibacteraceae bacterium]
MNSELNTQLLQTILDNQKRVPHTLSLADMGITDEIVNQIYEWAKPHAEEGELASYIPELARVDANKSAIVIGDLLGNQIVVGNGVDVKVSIQSVVKPFLYIYALEKGLAPSDISYIEPTAMHFNTDAVLQPESHKSRPGHPLNNAGAISSSGAIDDFDDFLAFMRRLAGNAQLAVLEDVYASEMATNANNRAIAMRLVATGRFATIEDGMRALDNYTRACAIGVTPAEITRACVVLARGGKIDGEQVIHENNIVRAINAMNSYGLYERTGEISLLAAGVRALSCKSGVGGLIINIDPGRGAFTTYGPRLDAAGNSAFGKYALIPLNNLLAAPYAMRLSADEIINTIAEFE